MSQGCGLIAVRLRETTHSPRVSEPLTRRRRSYTVRKLPARRQQRRLSSNQSLAPGKGFMYRVLAVTIFWIAAWALPALSQAAQPATPPPPDDPPPVLSVPKDYKYDSRGRRDPFVNPVPKPVSAAGTPAAPAIRP